MAILDESGSNDMTAMCDEIAREVNADMRRSNKPLKGKTLGRIRRDARECLTAEEIRQQFTTGHLSYHTSKR